jgi:hypothetical protein
MEMSAWKTLRAAAALTVFAAGASAQQLETCTGGTANTTPSIRAEGTTELIGTFSFTCSGPGATGANIDLILSPTVSVTSKVLNASSGATEAIAIATAGASSSFVQGTVMGSSVSFSNLKLPAGSVTVSIANVRVNASQLPAGNVPQNVSATAFISGSGVNPEATASALVAEASSGLGSQSVSGVKNFFAPGPISASAGPAFTVTFAEGFPNAFKVQAGETGNTENGALANTANSGTRVQIAFTKVPANVNVYVPTRLADINGGGTMTLTASGTGAFSAVPALNPTSANTLPASPGLAQAAIASGSGSVFYELTQTNGVTVQSFSVPVYISAGSGVVSTGDPVGVAVNLAPVGSTNIPNFVVGSSTVALKGSVISPLTMSCNPSTGPVAVGVAYVTTCTAAGGVPPYTFGPTAALPAGLGGAVSSSTTTTISGTPTAAGSYNYGIYVEDSENPPQEFIVPFAGTIASAPGTPVLSMLSPSGATAGSAALTLSVTGSGFTQNAQIAWNGTALSTVFSNSTQLFGTVPASLLLTPATVTVTVSQGGLTSSSLPFTIVPAVTSGTPMVLPHIAVNGPYVTGFYVVNSGAAAAQYKISLLTDGGTALSTPVTGLGTVSVISGVLPALGSAYFEAGSATLPLAGGSAQVSADASISVQGLFRLDVAGTNGAPDSYYEAAVNASAGSKDFVIPFDVTNFVPTGQQIFTGIAIASLDPAQSATVTCAARDTTGKAIPNAVTVPVLPPLGHWAGFNFPALVGLRGELECTANTSIGALAIHALPTGGISSLPVILK